MSELNQEKKARNRFPDRFTVEPENLEKLNQLMEQLIQSKQGISVTRKEMLNWMIERFSDQLSQSDLKDLSDRFYDEERFLRLAWEEVRAAKSRGERITLEEILKRGTPATHANPRRPRRKKQETEHEGGKLDLADPEMPVV